MNYKNNRNDRSYYCTIVMHKNVIKMTSILLQWYFYNQNYRIMVVSLHVYTYVFTSL